MTSKLRFYRVASALLMLLAGQTEALEVSLRPQGEVLTRTVQNLLQELSTRDVPVRLNTSATSGTTMTMGGVGVSAAPFNPEVASRVVMVGSERRIEFNPQSSIPLPQAVKEELMRELGLKAWSAAEAQRRFTSADLNGDGVTNLADLAVLMENFGKNTTVGDLNQDRKIDDSDVRLFMAQYAKADSTVASPTDTPEAPASAPSGTTPSTPTPTTPTSPEGPGSVPDPAATPAPTTPAPTTPAPSSPTTPATPTDPAAPKAPEQPAPPPTDKSGRPRDGGNQP